MTTNLKRAVVAAAGALSMLGLAACSETTDDTNDLTTQENLTQTVATLVGQHDELSTLASELSKNGLSAMLDGQASYTVLAPTDAAFAAVPGGKELLGSEANQALVAAILRDHLLPGSLTPESIKQAISDNGGPVSMRSFGEGSITFAMEGETITISGPNGASAKLSEGAIVGSNGVVIPIDALAAKLPDAE